MASRQVAGAIALVAGAAAALAAGVATAWFGTGRSTSVHGRGPGPWKASSGTGEASGAAFDRAVVARTAIWALPQSEVVYFIADTDDDGRPLDIACRYDLVRRGEMKARWWSVTAYRDGFWIANPRDRYSFSSTNVARDPSGDFTIHLSREAQPGNWLPLGGKHGRISVTTRLYMPDRSVITDPEAVPLPAIRRVACA